ncbi:hypothetical protein ABFS82_02G046700 [Erythranthe guttata]
MDTKHIDTMQKYSTKKSAKRVRMTMPFGLKCNKCDRHTDKGEKLYCFKRAIGIDSTFEVEIFRFEFWCQCCRSDFSIVSDPGRYDYVLESGAKGFIDSHIGCNLYLALVLFSMSSFSMF